MRTIRENERRFIERMPKAEIHVHLEGSVYPATLLDLGRKYGLEESFPFHDVAGARDWFRFRDFPHFIEIYVTICNTLLAAEDYERVTYEMAERGAAENIRYMEITFAPASILNPRTTGVPDVALAGMRAAARRAKTELGVQMQFILDGVRTRSEEEVMELARWTAGNLGDGLAGFGLGGIELGNPASRYTDAFRYASDAGAGIAIHAGETDGPESIRDALSAGAERIGHGVTSVRDPSLVTELAERRTVLEISPTSNVSLGVTPSYAEHPIRELYDAEVPVTVNSDDPPMFNTTLTNEFIILAEQFGFTIDELSGLSLSAVDAAFLPKTDRSRLREEFTEEIDQLRRELSLG